MRGLDPRIHVFLRSALQQRKTWMAGTSQAMTKTESVRYAAADLPIAAFTRGITCSAISVIDRFVSSGSTQSMPA